MSRGIVHAQVAHPYRIAITQLEPPLCSVTALLTTIGGQIMVATGNGNCSPDLNNGVQAVLRRQYTWDM